MADTDGEGSWALIGPVRACPGFVYGLRHPSMLLAVQVGSLPASDRIAVQSRLSHALGEAQADLAVPFGAPGSQDDAHIQSLRWFLAMADRFNALAGLPIMDKALSFGVKESMAYCAVPSLPTAFSPLTALLTHLLRLAQCPGAQLDGFEEKVRTDFARLRAANFVHSNVPRFIRAAIEQGVAVQELPGGTVQYGLGSKSVWMDSTLTPFTSAIGMRAARDKAVTAQLLGRFRLPVAGHRIANDVEEALRGAAELGYPVVVKPCDLDGGVAVQADLRSADEVRRAVQAARQHSQRIMIEKHFAGRDYRLTVFRGAMFWAVERRPASVVGDGVHSIAELVAHANADPARGEGPHARLKPLKLDEEALELLSREGFTTETIPNRDQCIRLRRAANVSRGGEPITVIDRVHPDNADLAVRAAAILNLDLAGVDLIIPDIARSWREGGAIICEVNAQPQLGGTTSVHLYPQLMRRLLDGDGHIPVIAFLGGEQADSLARHAAEILEGEGLSVGLHVREGVRVAGRWIEKGEVPCLAAGRMLGADRSVDALLLGVLNARVTQTGLPVPRIDLLVVTGEEAAEPEPNRPGEGGAIAATLLRMMAPACSTIVKVDGLPAGPEIHARLQQLGTACRVVSPEQIDAALRRAAAKSKDRPLVPVPPSHRSGPGQTRQ